MTDAGQSVEQRSIVLNEKISGTYADIEVSGRLQFNDSRGESTARLEPSAPADPIGAAATPSKARSRRSRAERP